MFGRSRPLKKYTERWTFFVYLYSELSPCLVTSDRPPPMMQLGTGCFFVTYGRISTETIPAISLLPLCVHVDTHVIAVRKGQSRVVIIHVVDTEIAASFMIVLLSTLCFSIIQGIRKSSVSLMLQKQQAPA